MKQLTLSIFIIALTLGCSKPIETPSTFEIESAYDFATSQEIITTAAKEAGWTMPTEYDMQATFKKNGHDVLPFQIFALCNSTYAKQVLDNDKARLLASIMPCRVGIYQKANGSVYVAWSNLEKLGNELGEPVKSILDKVAVEINNIAESVLE